MNYRIVGAMFAATALGALTALMITGHPTVPLRVNEPAVSSIKGAAAAVPPCADRETVLGTVAALKSGADPTALRGTAVLTENPSISGSLGQTLVFGSNVPTAASDPGSVAASGTVYAQSSRASLRSCEYHLSGSTADAAYIALAKGEAVADGFATSAQLDSDATLYFVSDDPTDSDRLIVTLDTLGASVPQADGSTDLHALKTFFALISVGSGLVTGTTSGIW
ncbi:MAG: hypothetical protein WAW53_00250 [Candidatus Dormiibacterota bacterium]